ncbi:phage tail sheath subtilisin-like domain-containing protein [candidate division KSB1 bacterium]|nr:phage tail sheath subtilisin-like domain-containing protein [candidate division KSB1 bacterium]
MPVTPTFPGVYIEEVPSGVRTITGVATSITAFIGRALRGPVNDPITINSFGDFERIFGGLWAESATSFAVRDFYQNGGSQAITVRLFHPSFTTEEERNKALAAAQAVAAATTGADAEAAKNAARAKAQTYTTEPEKTAADKVAKAAEAEAARSGATAASVKAAADAAVGLAAPITKARLQLDTLNLEAAYEGAWGNFLRARVDHDVKGPEASSLFNLSIRDGLTGQIEQFRNVSVALGHARQVDKVLLNESRLARVRGTLPATRPAAHPEPQPGKDVWGDNNPATNSKVVDADKASDGDVLERADFTGPGKEGAKQGLFALKKADLFNILCIPSHRLGGDIEPELVGEAAKYCEDRRAMFIVDPSSNWGSKDDAKGNGTTTGVAAIGTTSKNAALFFPHLHQPNVLRDNQMENFVPCGAVAGIFARTDAQRGVWKAPAGLEATLVGVPQLSVALTDAENGELNPLGVNCLRTFPPAGRVVWGSRTLQGDDRFASEWKYIPVRRMALFIEESLYRGLKWVVFEPNDEPLWSQIRLNVGAFMQNLFRQGAFQGRTASEAYFVKCDKETTTQNDINLGIVNILVGFAPLKPAEFVIIRIQQIAGQIQA